MAEQAGRCSAPPKRREPAPQDSVQRHAMLERRAAAQPAAAYGAMLNARPAGPQPVQTGKAANRTGLPNQLKQGVEALSGLSLDDVRVHYNSSRPAKLDALAYAQGKDIHLGPGQEQHLPHEAWHVVQQAQGRVKPTAQMKDGMAINDDLGLEHEADVMGAKALERTDGPAGQEATGEIGTPAIQMMTARLGRLRPPREPTQDEIDVTTAAATANHQRLAGHGRARHGRQVEVPDEQQERQRAEDLQNAIDTAIQLRR
ncbi:MAG: hypothetical protein QOJ53_529 [Sphingomonadales bacterium]|jgi:hypothetical protein|nr:hypothetical protein [Sphingomonadales bacterium]